MNVANITVSQANSASGSQLKAEEAAARAKERAEQEGEPIMTSPVRAFNNTRPLLNTLESRRL